MYFCQFHVCRLVHVNHCFLLKQRKICSHVNFILQHLIGQEPNRVDILLLYKFLDFPFLFDLIFFATNFLVITKFYKTSSTFDVYPLFVNT